MARKEDSVDTIEVGSETRAWLRHVGADLDLPNDDDTIHHLLQFYDAYAIENHHRTTEKIEALMPHISPQGAASYQELFAGIISLDPGHITYTLRKFRENTPLRRLREIIITFYHIQRPFCIAQITLDEDTRLYLPGYEAASPIRGWKMIHSLEQGESDAINSALAPLQEVITHISASPPAFEVRLAGDTVSGSSVCTDVHSSPVSAAPAFKGDLTKKGRIYFDFWRMFLGLLRGRGVRLFSGCKAIQENRLVTGGGISQASFKFTLEKSSVLVLYRINKGVKGSALYNRLLDARSEIEDTFGDMLDWDDSYDKFCYIRWRIWNVDPTDRGQWEEIHFRMANDLLRLSNAIRPFIRG